MIISENKQNNKQIYFTHRLDNYLTIFESEN